MQVDVLLAVIVLLAAVGRASSVGVAAGILLIIRMMGLDRAIPGASVEKNCMFWGLVLLTVSVLSGFVWGRLTISDAASAAKSWMGVMAFAVSLGFTWLTGRGAYFLTEGGHSEYLPVLVFGAVLAAIFLKGVPVGPLTTSGVLYLLYSLMERK